MSVSSPSRLVPSRSALLLTDFQNGALNTVADTADLLDRAGHARGAADATGMPVVYTRVAFAPDQLAAIPDRNKTFAAIAAVGSLADGSPQTQIPPAIAPRAGDRVFTKIRVSASAPLSSRPSWTSAASTPSCSRASRRAGSCYRPYGTQPTAITGCSCSRTAAPIPTRAYTRP
jgi:predicted component of type VI protein secretion system